MDNCCIRGCSYPIHGVGLCKTHYTDNRRTGIHSEDVRAHHANNLYHDAPQSDAAYLVALGKITKAMPVSDDRQTAFRKRMPYNR